MRGPSVGLLFLGSDRLPNGWLYRLRRLPRLALVLCVELLLLRRLRHACSTARHTDGAECANPRRRTTPRILTQPPAPQRAPQELSSFLATLAHWRGRLPAEDDRHIALPERDRPCSAVLIALVHLLSSLFSRTYRECFHTTGIRGTPTREPTYRPVRAIGRLSPDRSRPPAALPIGARTVGSPRA